MNPIEIYYKNHQEEVKEKIENNSRIANKKILLESVEADCMGLLNLALESMPRDDVPLEGLFTKISRLKHYKCFEMLLCHYKPTDPILRRLARDSMCTETPFKILRDWVITLRYKALAHNAKEGGDQLKKVIFFIEEGEVEINHSTLLYHSVSSKVYHIASYLLEKNADPNLPSEKGETPLNLAGESSSLTKLLLRAGAVPDTQDAIETPKKFITRRAMALSKMTYHVL